MGRILDALTHSEDRSPPVLTGDFPAPPAQPELRCVGQPDPIGDEPESGEEVPFIEVGPQHSMEASASVLASAPPPFGGPRLVTPPEAEPKAAQAAPSSVTPPRGSRLAPELIAYHRPEHDISKQYHRLLEPLLARTPAGRSQTLLFSSARPGCGTTTVLLNVAIAAARQARRRVVVVDGNLRHPALAERLGLGEVGGLRDVLAGALPLEQALRETDQVNLFALTAAGPAVSTAQTAGIRCVTETMRSVLRQLRQRFDLVLVDGPRWDGQPDVIQLGAACDAVYLVLAEAEAESPQVDDLYLAIPEQGVRLAGCILAG